MEDADPEITAIAMCAPPTRMVVLLAYKTFSKDNDGVSEVFRLPVVSVVTYARRHILADYLVSVDPGQARRMEIAKAGVQSVEWIAADGVVSWLAVACAWPEDEDDDRLRPYEKDCHKCAAFLSND